MNYGSERVWVYDCSDEEFVSEGELEDGMWLSASEDSDEDNNTIVPLAGASAGPRDESYEGSTTKFLPPEPESDQEEGAQAKGAEPSSSEKKGEYADLDLPKDGKVKSKPDKQSTDYTKVKPSLSAPNPPPPPVLKVTPAIVPSVRSSGPLQPPAAPSRGIMKNRLFSQRLRRLKKTRATPSVGFAQDSGRPSRGRRVRRSDTNILAVKFNKLIEPSDVHTGDAVFCGNKNCSAVLCHLSTITDQEDKTEKLWVCEFCGEQNEVDVVPEELPTKEDTTFLISPAPTVEGKTGGGVANVEEALVVFCIDISGSMCVTTEVPGKFVLKGHERVKDLSSLNVNNEDQYLPRQRRDVTYVSRLQSVQAAVDQQLTQLASTNPSQRVALVTFSDEVTLIGDGRGDTFTLAGDKLWNSDAIVKVGSDVPLPSAVSITKKALSEKVFQLEESGQTALGPALLVSISMAARVSGSKVIICTDGLANKGVGNLDGLSSAEDRAAAQTFYEDMGSIALEKNVTVSLVRIKGTDCKALELGQVADKTGGDVTTVDPLNITQEFASILANPVIATNVKTRIVLHGQLYFRTEETQESTLVIPVGNVTAETELTYEYGARSSKKSPASTAQTSPSPEPSPEPSLAAIGGASPLAVDTKVPPMMKDGKPHLPFQLQIEYTGRDGSQCMRVISEAKPVTRDRSEAERDIRMNVVGSHVAHKTAKLAMEGEYTSARLNAHSCQRLLQRSSHISSGHRSQYTTVMEDIIPLEQVLNDKQRSERHILGRQYSDDEDEEDQYFVQESDLMVSPLATPQQPGSAAPPRAAPKKKKAISRRNEISDDLATYCYNMKKQNY